jgi:hypothetical protein
MLVVARPRDAWPETARASRGPPRTRQSSPALAAFRPWGIEQDAAAWGVARESRRPSYARRSRGATGEVGGGGRRTTRTADVLAWAERFREAVPAPVASSAEDSPSGLWRSLGKRVGLTALRGSNPLSSATLTSADAGAGSTSRTRRPVSGLASRGRRFHPLASPAPADPLLAVPDWTSRPSGRPDGCSGRPWRTATSGWAGPRERQR